MERVRSYEKTFSMKKPVSPLLSELREIFRTFTEPEARLLFMSLEAYTDYAYQTLAKQSSFKTTKRFVVFGLHGVPENMWEPIMLTVMHVLSQRMSYNQTLQRATHFIVDEAQYVCTHESSALELQKAFLTYRKYGGICTICLQNAAAAFANTAIQNIVSNSDFKLILDQGSNDRNLLTQIVDLSEKEFQKLASETVGQSLLVWGKQIIPLDSRISNNSPLYALYTTNFHEQAVGSSYNRNNRMGERVYDCSSLAFRAYDSAGIKYLNGMTAAGEAEYLDNHRMTFHDRKLLQPGDLIFRTSSVTNKSCHLKDGRTTLVGHVENYIGNGMMIHASGGRRGVVKERVKYSNLSIGELYGRPQP